MKLTITNEESQTEISLENASLNENSPCTCRILKISIQLAQKYKCTARVAYRQRLDPSGLVGGA